MSAYKRGATLGIEVEFTEEEWAGIHPWDEIFSECENSTTEYPLTIATDAQTRTILLSSPTDNFLNGLYKADIRIVKNGTVMYVPKDGYINFKITSPVSEMADEVNTNAS